MIADAHARFLTLTTGMSTPADPTTHNHADASLIQFPCAFPVKVMGVKSDALLPTVIALVRQFDPALDESTLELRQSKGGKYQGITLTLTATSRAQLDDLYRALSGHPLVKMVL